MGNLFNRLYTDLVTRLQREDGQTLVEYSLIGLLVALAVVVALTTLGTSITTELGKISGALK